MTKKLIIILAILFSGIALSMIVILLVSDKPPMLEETQTSIEDEQFTETVAIDEVVYDVELVEMAIEIYYTVSDVNDYEYYMDVNSEYNDNGEINKEISKGFSEICTENGLAQIVSNRLFLSYMEAAYFDQFTITIKQIDYEIYFEKEGNGSILNPYDTVGYEYEVELLLEYVDGETETIFEDGHIHLGMIDGEWKVDQLNSRLLNDIFMSHY